MSSTNALPPQIRVQIDQAIADGNLDTNEHSAVLRAVDALESNEERMAAIDYLRSREVCYTTGAAPTAPVSSPATAPSVAGLAAPVMTGVSLRKPSFHSTPAVATSPAPAAPPSTAGEPNRLSLSYRYGVGIQHNLSNSSPDNNIGGNLNGHFDARLEYGRLSGGAQVELVSHYRRDSNAGPSPLNAESPEVVQVNPEFWLKGEVIEDGLEVGVTTDRAAYREVGEEEIWGHAVPGEEAYTGYNDGIQGDVNAILGKFEIGVTTPVLLRINCQTAPDNDWLVRARYTTGRFAIDGAFGLGGIRDNSWDVGLNWAATDDFDIEARYGHVGNVTADVSSYERMSVGANFETDWSKIF